MKFFRYIIFVSVLLAHSFLLAQGSGNALTYNGVNQYIDLGTTVAGNCRTIEFWFKPATLIDPNIPDVASFIARDYLNGSGVNLNEFGIHVPTSAWGATAGRIVFYRRVGSASYSVISNSNSWQANVWYHVAGVIDPVTGMKLYINGVLQASTDPSTQPVQIQTGSATDMVAIGTWGYWGANSGNRFYNGDMDEVRLWTTARTQTQVQEDMCRKISPVQPGLNAYYRFDQSAGTTLTDLTGNGYNGALVNIPSGSWHYSSAPIGDTSAYVYPGSFAGQTLTLSYAAGDVFQVSNVTTNPDGVHIYRVASLPNVTTGLTSPQPHYYGVFLTNTSGSYDIYEDFSAQTGSCQGSCLKLAGRENNAVLNWNGITPAFSNCTFSKTNESSVGVSYRAEYILSVGGGSLTVSSTNVTCNGGSDGTATATYTGGTLPYTYSWLPGSANSSGITTGAGNYTVTVTDGQGCLETASVTVNQPAPLLLTVPNATVCTAQTLSVTAQASGGTAPYTYVWNGTFNGQTYTANVTANTVYQVQATDANRCTSAIEQNTITVLPAPRVSVGDVSICAGNTATLTAVATSGSGNYTYTWSPGGMQGSQVVVSPSGTTIYTVTASDGCSATLAKDTGVVFVSGSIPVLTLPPAASGCTPVCMTFTMQNPGNSIVHWSWNFGDGIKDSVQNPAHCYNRPGNYSVSLAYASVSGCTAVVSKNSEVVVFPASVADFSASSSETDILDSYIQFYNQSANASSWHWSFGDSEYSGVQSPVHTYSGPGTYVVTLITNNAYGCADTITHTIEIKDVFTFYAPGAFSPNGDELNERFLPTGTGWDNSTFSMDVFDRWGNLVFHSRNPFEGWTIKDDKIPEDTYVWKVSLQDVYGKSHQYNGVVSLVK